MTATLAARPAEDDLFDRFVLSVRRYAEGVLGSAEPRATLFRTSARLGKTFLEMLPEGERRHHDCRVCQRFLHSYGGLVTLDREGAATPLFWGGDETPELYREAVHALRARVSNAMVTGIIYAAAAELGTPATGRWRHLSATLPASMVFRPTFGVNASQAMAARRSELALLERALLRFPIEVAERAVAMLEGEVLYRHEKCLGPARWFLGVHRALAAARNPVVRRSLLYRAIASAPTGFAHVRSTVIGTLLEDISAGLRLDEVQRRFAAKLDPRIYQRPTAAPSAGNIAEAERVIEALKAKGSLRRRYARLDEIETLWRPRPPEEPQKAPEEAAGGVFGHLRPKGLPPLAFDPLPPVRMTWEKFRRTVLPQARSIAFQVMRELNSFVALVTAADPESPPILQWDRPERRNPVSWYLYANGSLPERWNLIEPWVEVTAIALRPTMWDPERSHAHHGAAAIFVLKGCRDLETTKTGLALFPETLRGEFHAIRSTIEAYSLSGTLEEPEKATACGVEFSALPRLAGFLLRVTFEDGRTGYHALDRWD